MFGVGKTAFIDCWDRNGSLSMHSVGSRSKDISCLDGPKVAAGQYIFSHLVIFGSAWSPCWCLR